MIADAINCENYFEDSITEFDLENSKKSTNSCSYAAPRVLPIVQSAPKVLLRVTCYVCYVHPAEPVVYLLY